MYSGLSLLLEVATCIDGERKSCDVTGFVRGQEQHGIADVLGLHPADRQYVHELRGGLQILRSGLSRSGRNIFIVPSFMNIGVFTFVG